MFWNSPVWKKLQSFTDVLSWNLFFLTFATVVVDNLISLIYPGSRTFRFYSTLYAFEPLCLIWYISNVLQVIFNILIFVPFACYIFNKHLPFLKLWPWILMGKIFFDISGHYYQFVEYKSLFYLKPWFGLACLLAQILIWIPSYAAPIHLLIYNQTLKHSKPHPE